MEEEKAKIYLRAKPTLAFSSLILSLGFVVMILTMLNVLRYEVSRYILFGTTLILSGVSILILILYNKKMICLEWPPHDKDLMYLLVAMMFATTWLILAFFFAILGRV